MGRRESGQERAGGRTSSEMRVLITGGAGFVGSALARHFHRCTAPASVTVFDSLRRRGSEGNARALMSEGVRFVHGDVRSPFDLEDLEGSYDVLIEASAEPSVHAGLSGSPRYVLDTNVVGAMNCLEFARRRCGGVVFLSTSRVYSIEPLVGLPLKATESRYELQVSADLGRGLSPAGIREDFPCDSPRSFYGASKLAAELICQEYGAHGGLPVVVDRCGVIAGPGQFGRVDQGVFTLWVAHHHFGLPLRYTGFGGRGFQVRDLLHPADLCELVEKQLESWAKVAGRVFNVGGGVMGSVSLREFTGICQEVVGREVPIAEEPETTAVDVPWYVSDHSRVSGLLNWEPRRGPKRIVEDIAAWIRANEQALRGLFQGEQRDPRGA
jgi:CDP-paratose 2-epimerase